jgi:pimeloyl-ACP methyl ester carboxylesterase
MKDTYLDLDGQRLYYQDVAGPRNSPAIVLGHAAFLDSRMWDAQIDTLNQRYRVIRYDMLGFGRSGLVNGPRSRRADLLRLLDHLDVGRAHYIGCSMGGEIGLDLALEHPVRIASLMLINSAPSGFAPQGEPPRYLFEMIDATQRGDFERVGELHMRIWFDGPFREPDQINSTLRARAREMNRVCVRQNTYVIADVEPANPLSPPAITRLRDVICPTTIVTGALDDPEILRAGRLMADAIPNARYTSIANTAHVPSFEDADAFEAVLAGHLQMLTTDGGRPTTAGA